MSKINELPCESLVRKICGSNWRNLPDPGIDGAWGVAIVRSIVDGVRPNTLAISAHLGVHVSSLRRSFHNLEMNGVLSSIENDDGLNTTDYLPWSYYAGYAGGYIGPYKPW